MEEFEIEYTIKFNKGYRKGEIVNVIARIDEIEDNGLDMFLIIEGYLESTCNNNEYEVLDRKIN